MQPSVCDERAAVYALKDDRERLFAALEQIREPIDVVLELDRNPVFPSVRADSRFQSILSRLRRALDVQRVRAAERVLLDLTALIGAF